MVEVVQLAELLTATPAAWGAVAAGGATLFLKHSARIRAKARRKLVIRRHHRRTGVQLMREEDIAALIANFDPLRAELAMIRIDLNMAGDTAPLAPFIERTRHVVGEMQRLCRYLGGLNLAFANMTERLAFQNVIATNRAWAARLNRVMTLVPEHVQA